MIKFNSPHPYYIITIGFIPLILRAYWISYIDNFWLALISNIVSLFLVYSTFIILTKNLKEDYNKNLSTLIFSIIAFISAIYIIFLIFSDYVVFVGGKHFNYVVYSYLIYSPLFLFFLFCLIYQIYFQLKNA